MEFIIHYSDNNFEFNFSERIEDSSQFEYYISFLKSKYFKYNSEKKVWCCDEKTLQEKCLWLDKEEINYNFTKEALYKLKELKNNYKQDYQFFRNQKLDPTTLNSDVKLYDFQKEGIQFLLERNRSLCADDMGVGKTIQSIAYFSNLFKTGKIDGLFLIVRTGTTYNWFREIKKFMKDCKEDKVVIINNSNKKQVFENYTESTIIIVPNHLVKDIFLSYKKNHKFGKSAKRIHWKVYVDIKKEWKKKNLMLLIDECHEFANPDSIRTKAILHHKEFFDYRLLLSGTPALNKFEKWWTHFEILSPAILKMSYNAFRLNIAQSIGNNFDPYSINRYNTDEIEILKNNVIDKFVIKRLKKDLPEVKTKQIIKPIYLQMTPLQSKLYYSFIRYERSRLEEEFDSISIKLIMQKFPYLVQIIDNPLLLENKIIENDFNKLLGKWNLDKDSRIEYLDSALKDYIKGQNTKVVLFDNHPKTLDLLAERYKNYNPLVVHGRLKDDEKDRLRKQDLFNDKTSKYKIFLISTQIGGSGWNLHEGTNRIIFYTSPNDSILYHQACQRCHRVTSEKDAIIEVLLIDSTIDLIRYQRNNLRVELNDLLHSDDLTKNDLDRLFQGILSN